MSIKNKISLSFLSIALIFLVFFATREYVLSDANKEFIQIPVLYSHSLAMAEQLNSIGLLESNIDSYIVIGSTELEEWILNYSANSSVKVLDLAPDAEIKEKIAAVFSDLEQNIIGLIKLTKFSEDRASINGQVLKVYASIDKLKELEETLLDSETVVLQSNIKKYVQTVSMISKLSLWVGAIMLIVGILLSILISHNLAKPLGVLRDVAEKVGKGNWDVAVAVQSKDEIGDLSVAFNKMITDLKKSRVALDDSNKKLSGSAKQLAGKVAELEKINKLIIGRELKMIDLKKEIEALKEKSGKT